MQWLDRIKAYFRWSWVGTVEGVCHLVDEKGNRTPGGNSSCYWNLYERGDGKRRSSLIGYFHGSQSSRLAKAAVEAWVHGGPLPTLYKSPSPQKPKPQLIAFPGGKDGAA